MKTLDYPPLTRNFKCLHCIHFADCPDDDSFDYCESIDHECSICPFIACSKCDDYDLFMEARPCYL